VLEERALLWSATINAIILAAAQNWFVRVDLFNAICTGKDLGKTMPAFLEAHGMLLNQYYTVLIREVTNAVRPKVTGRFKGLIA